jgi:monoamine oxidase
MVKQINWKKNNTEVLTQYGDRYEAKKILVTVPAGILKSSEVNKAFIKFNPGLKEISGALNSIGYGPVVKVFFEFKEAFWDTEETGARKLHQSGFIISDTIFTAWWSQLPKKVPILTGWFAGPNVDKMQNMSSNHLIEEAVSALCKIFDAEKSFIEKKINSAFIANWKEDPFSLGAYSYATVETPNAKKVLNRPTDDTIFFAGEALSEDESIGTVEAAFASGLSAAKKILNF